MDTPPLQRALAICPGVNTDSSRVIIILIETRLTLVLSCTLISPTTPSNSVLDAYTDEYSDIVWVSLVETKHLRAEARRARWAWRATWSHRSWLSLLSSLTLNSLRSLRSTWTRLPSNTWDSSLSGQTPQTLWPSLTIRTRNPLCTLSSL